MNLWVLITELGEEKLYFALIPFVYFVFDRKTGWRLFLALLLSSLTVLALKDWLKLPRPPKKFWKVSAEGYGFPSGHTTVSATFWSFLALKRSVFALGLILAILVGISRVMLGVHYVRDVVGGFIIGASVGVLSNFVDLAIPTLLLSLAVYPLVGIKSLEIGGYVLGFGLAHHISVRRFDPPKSLKVKIAMALLSLIVLPLGFFYPIFSPVAGFLGCFVPNYIGGKMK